MKDEITDALYNFAEGKVTIEALANIIRQPAALEVGDRAWYYPRGGGALEATITGVGQEVGQLVYDCDTPLGSRWGYADQFEKMEAQ